MSLQNRVDPWGALHAVAARGTLIGNRGGKLHRPDQTLGRKRWVSRAWICCELHYKDWHHEPMGQGYTSLFFLDEVTALAAGHRPCFMCRRKEAQAFLGGARAEDFDRQLHRERLAPKHPLHGPLPDGAMIATGDQAYAQRGGRYLRWSFAGYAEAAPDLRVAKILTPPMILAILARGYQTRWHEVGTYKGWHMKLLRFGAKGKEKPGLLDKQGKIRDLSGHIADITGETISPKGLARLRKIKPESLPLVRGNPRIGACIGNPQKFVAIGLNYSDHAAESGLQVPPEPVVFTKHVSCLSGPNDTVTIPPKSKKSDWEVELGVIIGTKAKNIPRRGALAYVAGYCTINDLSEREFQTERSGQWTKGKCYDTFGPVGPWLVTADEVPDPQKLGLWLELNGKRVQNGNTSTMVYGVEFIVSYLSEFFTLMPGDIITTGTPPGVGMGMKPPRYLKPGDKMRLGIDGLGEQSQVVVRDK